MIDSTDDGIRLKQAALAEWLSGLRHARGWSQSELARRMVAEGWDTYSQMTVARTENSQRVVGAVEYFGLMRIFGEPASEPVDTSAELASLRAFKARVMEAMRSL